MIPIPKTLLKAIKEGEATPFDLVNHLQSFPINDILNAFAELIIISDDMVNKPQITVTEEEYNTIMGLFKIKGQRTLDGMVISETRGRPKKQKIVKEKL